MVYLEEGQPRTPLQKLVEQAEFLYLKTKRQLENQPGLFEDLITVKLNFEILSSRKRLRSEIEPEKENEFRYRRKEQFIESTEESSRKRSMSLNEIDVENETSTFDNEVFYYLFESLVDLFLDTTLSKTT